MGKGSANNEARAARREEDARQNRIDVGTERINHRFDRQFTPQFYQDQSKAYRQFAVPQLRDQYKDAGSELTFDLARRGLTDSSVRADKSADLSELYELNRQDIEGKAQQAAKDARSGVEDARGDLIMSLQATGDAAGAGKAALSRADVLSKPENYSPLEDMFLKFTSTLGTQSALERAYAAGSGVKPRFNTGIYGPGSSSVKVS
jgi:hypothetical protein